MLKPRCGFKASDALKASVLARAEACPPMLETRRFARRIWPWIAAACVAAALVIAITKTEVEPPHVAPMAQQREEGATPPTLVAQIPALPEVEHAVADARPEVVIEAPVVINSAPIVDESITAVTPADIDFDERLAMAAPPALEVGPNILLEADLPITNAENYYLTPEELALVRKQEQIEILETMRLEMEVVQMMIKSNEKYLEK